MCVETSHTIDDDAGQDSPHPSTHMPVPPSDKGTADECETRIEERRPPLKPTLQSYALQI